MAHAEANTTINRPASAIYDLILDGINNQKCRLAVLDIERVPGKPSGVGALYKQQGVKGPNGRRIDADYEITEARPNELIKFNVIAGPARPSGVYTFEPAGNATLVNFSLDYAPKGLVKLMDPMITATMRSEVATLSDLKAELESSSS